MNRSCAVTATLSMLLMSTAAFSHCLVLPPDHLSDKAAFITSVVRSLGEFQSAQNSMGEVGKANQTDVGMITAIDVANDHLECASDQALTFKASSDQATRLAIYGLLNASTEISSLNLRTKQALIDEMNGAYAQEKPGDHAARLASLGGKYRLAWSLVSSAADAAILALEEPDAPNSNHLRLALTASQRDSLNDSLLRMFPTLAHPDSTTALTAPEMAGGLIYYGVNNKSFSLRPDSDGRHE